MIARSGVVELRQLEHFLAVVEEGSFTAAATRLFLVQSSLSASLLALERNLGTTLFIRGRRGAELTDAGRALVGPAREALAAVQGAQDAVAEVRGLVRGTVCIATLPGGLPASLDVCETTRLFRQEHPGVEVHLFTADARSMVDLVAEGQVDFAVTPRTDHMTRDLRFEPLISAQLALICDARHRFAGAREVDPSDVLHEPIIDLPRSWQSRVLFDRLLENHGGRRRQAALEVDNWLAALAMVRRGVGVAYGPVESADPAVFEGLQIATLAGAPMWELGIATRDEALRGAAGRAFLGAYRERWATAPAGWSSDRPDQ
jgi:DNA-binding transcriptional LysR family regulator